MRLREAEETYQHAAQCYVEGRFADALAATDALAALFRNSTKIGYLRAQNIAALGYADEAGKAMLKPSGVIAFREPFAGTAGSCGRGPVPEVPRQARNTWREPRDGAVLPALPQFAPDGGHG